MNYHASKLDMSQGITTEIEADHNTTVVPTLAFVLGLNTSNGLTGHRVRSQKASISSRRISVIIFSIELPAKKSNKSIASIKCFEKSRHELKRVRQSNAKK